ncbi:MAG: histidine kinase N-terminal 7TM domain-containing protein [Halanaerobiales bacterium]
MHYQFSSYLLPHLISLLILTGLGIFGYKHRNSRAARGFIASVVIIAFWILSFMMGIAAVDYSVKLFWSNIQYIAFSFSPVFWLILVFQFTGSDDWINKRNIILLSIVPILTSILVWTKFIRVEVALDNLGIYPITTEFGPWFTVHYVYSYILIVISIIFLVSIIWRKKSTFRKQAIILLVGISITLLIDYLSVFELLSFDRTVADPVVFTIFSLIVGIGIFYFQLFDLVPVARETVIEEMESGVIVVDRMKRIVDINSAARKMFVFQGKIKTGEPLRNLSIELDESIEPDMEFLAKEEFEYKKDSQIYHYELNTSSIKDYQGDISSWILIINDISSIKKANERIKTQIEELAVYNERERMGRELHDNLGQVLSFSDIQIQSILKKLKKKQYRLAEKYLKKLNRIIKDTHKEVREYVYSIRDNSNYNKDFIILLEEELGKLKELKENTLVDIRFEAKGELNLTYLGTEEKVHLLYIMKEAVTNALKYAEADEIIISLAERNDELEMGVKDDGRGIESLDEKRGSGLSIMHERARLISGEFRLETKPGEGTSIYVILPGKTESVRD